MGETPDRYTPDVNWRDEFQLQRAYWDYYWSTYQIAEWVGVSDETVTDAMDEFDIPRRGTQQCQDVRWMRVQGRSLDAIDRKIDGPGVDEATDDEDISVEWGKLQ